VHPYKKFLLPCYRVSRKTVKSVPMVPKAHDRANVCAHRKSIKPCNFQNIFGGFLYGMISTAADTSILCRFLRKKNYFTILLRYILPMFWYISGINILRKSGFICRNVSNLSFKLFLNFEYVYVIFCEQLI